MSWPLSAEAGLTATKREPSRTFMLSITMFSIVKKTMMARGIEINMSVRMAKEITDGLNCKHHYKDYEGGIPLITKNDILRRIAPLFAFGILLPVALFAQEQLPFVVENRTIAVTSDDDPDDTILALTNNLAA